MAEYLRSVIGGEFRPARRLAQGSALGSDGDPGIIAHQDIFDGYYERVARLSAFEPEGAANGIGQRRRSVKSRPQGRDGFVFLRLEIAGAGVLGFNLNTLAALDAQERLVLPIKGIFAGLVASNSLHGVS